MADSNVAGAAIGGLAMNDSVGLIAVGQVAEMPAR